MSRWPWIVGVAMVVEGGAGVVLYLRSRGVSVPVIGTLLPSPAPSTPAGTSGGTAGAANPGTPAVPPVYPAPTITGASVGGSGSGPGPTACSSQVFSIADAGQVLGCVKTIQTTLNTYNANPARTGFAKIVVDGDFGPITQSAVELFQRNNHLTVDGIVGPQTWGRLLTPSAWQYPG